MADEKAVGRHGAEHAGFRISGFLFRGLERGLLGGAAAFLEEMNVVDPHVLDGMAGDAADD